MATCPLVDPSRAPFRPRRCRTVVVVALAADHQFPGDACGLVGQRHRGQLRRLAPNELRQPGRGRPRPLLICWITAWPPPPEYAAAPRRRRG